MTLPGDILTAVPVADRSLLTDASGARQHGGPVIRGRRRAARPGTGDRPASVGRRDGPTASVRAVRSLEGDRGAGALEGLALAFSAASLLTFSRTAFGAPSTRSLASFRPRPVSSRTSLMTWIFLSPAASRTTSNSSCSGLGLGRRGRRRRRGGGDGDRRGGGDAEGLLELLHELGELDAGSSP